MTEATNTQLLLQMADKLAIQEVLVRYCRGIDRCDADMLRSAYWEDATDDHGTFSGNAMDFCDHVLPALRKMERTMHAISNVYIELDGDRAKSETYCAAYHLLGNGDEMTVGGRYLDLLEKREAEWRIQRRVYVMDWNQNGPASAEFGGAFYGQFRNVGGRFPEDPWYSFSR